VGKGSCPAVHCGPLVSVIADVADTQAWRPLVQRALTLVETPCYIMSAARVGAAVTELRAHLGGVPHRHWLSVKTQPVRALLELWRDWQFGVEVVSAFELAAAMATGFAPDRILANGTGKQRWLARGDLRGLHVHFDSLTEIHALADVCREQRWAVGLRCQVPDQVDPNRPDRPDHFGMSADEVCAAAAHLRARGVGDMGVHCHLHTNVATAGAFARALAHLRGVCDRAGLEPSYVDVGGGLPVPGERSLSTQVSTCASFDAGEWAAVMATVPALFPTARELWLENGRFMTARAGVLIVTVVDRKERGDTVYYICDGGRTNHARMAAFEQHALFTDPSRDGPSRPSVVCGPTCASVDQLGEYILPDTIRVGDRLVWMNAGAYAVPLETRFSSGLAPVVWHDLDDNLRVVRARETAQQWWGQWA
jgi:diaminopimelate decarboxylase